MEAMFANLSRNILGRIFAKFLRDPRRRSIAPLSKYRAHKFASRPFFSPAPFRAQGFALYRSCGSVAKARPRELIPSKDEAERGGEGRRKNLEELKIKTEGRRGEGGGEDNEGEIVSPLDTLLPPSRTETF